MTCALTISEAMMACQRRPRGRAVAETGIEGGSGLNIVEKSPWKQQRTDAEERVHAGSGVVASEPHDWTQDWRVSTSKAEAQEQRFVVELSAQEGAAARQAEKQAGEGAKIRE